MSSLILFTLSGSSTLLFYLVHHYQGFVLAFYGLPKVIISILCAKDKGNNHKKDIILDYFIEFIQFQIY
jgi:hypothetical protein